MGHRLAVVSGGVGPGGIRGIGGRDHTHTTNENRTSNVLIAQAEGAQGRSAGIRVDRYHGLAKGSKWDWSGKGILFDAWESRMGAMCI